MSVNMGARMFTQFLTNMLILLIHNIGSAWGSKPSHVSEWRQDTVAFLFPVSTVNASPCKRAGISPFAVRAQGHHPNSSMHIFWALKAMTLDNQGWSSNSGIPLVNKPNSTKSMQLFTAFHSLCNKNWHLKDLEALAIPQHRSVSSMEIQRTVRTTPSLSLVWSNCSLAWSS